MYPYILAILLLTGTPHSVSGERAYTEKQKEALADQLIQYLDEYEQTRSNNAAWLLYLLFDANPETISFAEGYIQDRKDRFITVHHLFDCMNTLPGQDEYDQSVSFRFIYCLNEPELILSFLHDYNNEADSNTKLYSLLDEHDLTDNQKIHLEYLRNPEKDYTMQFSDEPGILDFYYFDHIFNADNNHDNNSDDYLDVWMDDIANRSTLENTDHVVSLLVTINGLFKNQREHDIHSIAQQIKNYYDLPISKISLRILRYISFSAFFSGYYHYDIDLNRNLLIPISEYFELEEQLKARLDLGVSLYRIGNIQTSQTELENVYKSIDEFSDFRYQSALLNNLGIVYYRTGYFEDYLQLILQALDYARVNDDPNLEIQYLNNLHVYHKKIENWPVAIEYLNQIRVKATEIGDFGRLAFVNQSIATYYRDSQKDFDRALSYFMEAQELAKNSEDYRLLIRILSELARTYIQVGLHDRALETNNMIINNARSRDDKTVLLRAYIRNAEIYYDNQEHENAGQYIDSVLQMNHNILTFNSQVIRSTVLARHMLYNNNPEGAIAQMKTNADEVISRVRHSSESQSGRMILDPEYIVLFKLLINELVKSGQYEEAFFWMDEVKNLSAFTFYNNPALKASILSESELILDFALRNRIERLRSEIYNAEASQQIQLNNLLLDAISEQNILRRKVLQNVDLNPVNLSRLRRKLGRSDIVLYFSMYENYLFASTITSGSFNIQRIEFSDDTLSRVDSVVTSLSTDQVKLTDLEWIRELVLDDLDLSDRYTNIIVVPDDFLYHIPFEILPTGEVSGDYSYGDAKYLIEHASISYANSLKDLESSLSGTPRISQELDFIGFGISDFSRTGSQLLPGRSLPPLPLAEQEVREIASLLSELPNTSYRTGENGTEKQFRDGAGNSRILHIASHSEIFENDPLYSLVHMHSSDANSGDQQDDGLVYAYELFGMNLSSEMVMLNSCESGSGGYIQGSGIIGFSRAFNYAGVQSLVMNLWSIRDRSAYELSVSFYSYLNQGMSKQEAMRQAKIDYINQINSNPSNWGSFVVYGNTAAIVRTPYPWYAGIALLLIGSISIVIAWIRLARIPIGRIG